MGMLRSINSPGVELVEVDLSDYVSLLGGTTSLVIGFSPQGQSGVPVQPTSTSSVKSYFGTPKTEAERYFYYACKEVFDKGGRLIAARIPYNNNAQYLTPAVSYDIEEWQTTYVNNFGEDACYDWTGLSASSNTVLINTDSETKVKINGTQYSHMTVYAGIRPISNACPVWNSSRTYYKDEYVKQAITTSAWDTASTYAKDDYVLSGGYTWQSQVDNNTGNEPTTADSTKWARVHPFFYYKANIENKGKAPNDSAISAWSSTTTYLKNDIAKITVGSDEKYFVSNKSSNKYPIYADTAIVTEWDAETASYAAGTYVKKTPSDESSVKYYQAKIAVSKAGLDPATSTTYWKEVSLEEWWEETDVTSYWHYYEGKTESEVLVATPVLTAVQNTDIQTTGRIVRVTSFLDDDNQKVEPDYSGTTYPEMSGHILYVTLTDAGVNAMKEYLYDTTTDTLAAETIVKNSVVLSSDKYFNVNYYTAPSYTTIDGIDYNADVICNGCIYNPVLKYPTLSVIKKLTADENGESTVAVQMFYDNPNGRAVYPNCIPTDFIEYTLTTEGENALMTPSPKGPGISPSGEGGTKFTPEQIVENLKWLTDVSYFNISRYEFSEVVEKKEVQLSKFFQSAPVTTDITTGDEKWSSLLAIDATSAEWSTVSADYPEIMIADPFKNEDYKYVLKSLNNRGTYAYNEKDFIQFVSPFTSIEAVAKAGSQNYSWVRWVRGDVTTSTETSSFSESACVDNSLIMSRTVGCKMSEMPEGFKNIENVVNIIPNDDHFGFVTLSTYQDYRDGAKKVDANTITICNITEKQFGADSYNNNGLECLGILPILIGGGQAIPKQQIVTLPTDTGNGRIFNAVESIVRGSLYDIGVPESEGVDCVYTALNGDGFYKTVANEQAFNAFESTISNDMLGNVPTIQLDSNLNPDGVAKNKVTLVVCELATSKSFNDKVYVNVIESWTGSLDPDAVDGSNKSIFIDNIVNSEDSGSSYVRIFSNYQSAMSSYSAKTLQNETYRNTPTNDNTITLCGPASFGSQYWWTKQKESMSIGFVAEQTRKYIAYSTIAGTIEGVFDTLSNVDETEIDVVVDAGLSTIANRIKNLADDDKDQVKFEYDVFWEKIKSVDRAAGWKAICAKYITFCSSTRKDCLCVVDAPRNVSVKDSVKLVQPGGKYSVDFDILPTLNYISGLNSSYCGQYLNWISYVDDFSGKTVWLPPSIAANGAIVYTNYNYQYFDAPAGTKRGLVTAGIDVSFNPTAAQQDIIYGRSWNYYINTTADGIVLWGQKTSQTRTSALDRLNVRMLLLRLERLTRRAMKQFIFEGNTEKLRNKVVDTLTPIYENCKANGGVYDYRIVCSDLNNTASTIDNNELRVAIGVKPTKTAEFIHCTWYIMSTGADFAEMDSYL